MDASPTSDCKPAPRTWVQCLASKPNKMIKKTTRHLFFFLGVQGRNKVTKFNDNNSQPKSAQRSSLTSFRGMTTVFQKFILLDTNLCPAIHLFIYHTQNVAESAIPYFHGFFTFFLQHIMRRISRSFTLEQVTASCELVSICRAEICPKGWLSSA